MSQISKKIVDQCKEKLIQAKADLLNQLLDQKAFFSERRMTGDEADLSAQANDENRMFVNNRRIRQQLLEIESALARISSGNFGICEETQEPIEADRLLAIPWTRLSIEGAEIRETVNRRHMRPS